MPQIIGMNLLFLVWVAFAAAKTILLSNDDSFVSAEIRALYRELKAASYDVILVAPANQRSSYGGAFVVPEGNTLTEDSEFSYISKGSKAWGQDPKDDDIWYFAGTPASCISFAFEYLLPKKYLNTTIDLVVGGPNQGPNLTPGFFTSSGTMGAVYSAIYRGYPAISFSGSNLNNTFFKDSDADDKYDPANIYAKKAVELIDLVFKKDDLIPALNGLNVNFPEVGTLLDNETECTDPVWKFSTMLDGNVFVPIAKYDEDTDTFSSSYKNYKSIQLSCDKDFGCSLPTEYDVFWARNCTTSLSLFQTDFTGTDTVAKSVQSALSLLFGTSSSSKVVAKSESKSSMYISV